jgi:hypothetical protein
MVLAYLEGRNVGRMGIIGLEREPQVELCTQDTVLKIVFAPIPHLNHFSGILILVSMDFLLITFSSSPVSPPLSPLSRSPLLFPYPVATPT